MNSLKFMASGFSDSVNNPMLMHLITNPAFGGGFCERAAALLRTSSQSGNDCRPAGRNIMRPSA